MMRWRSRGGAVGPAAVNRYLLPNEQQVITVRKHPAVLIGPSALTLLGLLAAGVLSTTVLRSNGALVTVVWLAWLVLFVWLVWKAINWAVDFFVVTSNRMLLTSGVLTRKVAMMPLARVTDMSFQRSFAGRMLGFGEFIVESAGQDQALRNVDHIPYPEQLYLEVCSMIFPQSQCPMCKGKGTIFVKASNLTDDNQELREYIETQMLPRRAELFNNLQLGDRTGQTRVYLLSHGYLEFICPECGGGNPVVSGSIEGAGNDGGSRDDGT
jgi:membrane protein YdbS with pleckstrin-like domain